MFDWLFWRTTVFGLRRKFSDVSHVQTSAVADWLQQQDGIDVLLLDCRAQEEYAVSQMVNAVHVLPDANEQVLVPLVTQAIADKRDHLVCYCSVGYRSSVVARKIQVSYTSLSYGSRRKSSVIILSKVRIFYIVVTVLFLAHSIQ